MMNYYERNRRLLDEAPSEVQAAIKGEVLLVNLTAYAKEVPCTLAFRRGGVVPL